MASSIAKWNDLQDANVPCLINGVISTADQKPHAMLTSCTLIISEALSILYRSHYCRPGSNILWMDSNYWFVSPCTLYMSPFNIVIHTITVSPILSYTHTLCHSYCYCHPYVCMYIVICTLTMSPVLSYIPLLCHTKLSCTPPLCHIHCHTPPRKALHTYVNVIG